MAAIMISRLTEWLQKKTNRSLAVTCALCSAIYEIVMFGRGSPFWVVPIKSVVLSFHARIYALCSVSPLAHVSHPPQAALIVWTRKGRHCQARNGAQRSSPRSDGSNEMFLPPCSISPWGETGPEENEFACVCLWERTGRLILASHKINNGPLHTVICTQNDLGKGCLRREH